jgi:hypothetical protein
MKYYNYIVILFIIVSSCSEEPLATPPPPALLGCTDQNAVNYNSGATQDDGSCVLAPQNTRYSVRRFLSGGYCFLFEW